MFDYLRDHGHPLVPFLTRHTIEGQEGHGTSTIGFLCPWSNCYFQRLYDFLSPWILHREQPHVVVHVLHELVSRFLWIQWIGRNAHHHFGDYGDLLVHDHRPRTFRHLSFGVGLP